MSTIPFSSVAQVVPSVLSAGGVALDLNGLMLTQNTLAPIGQLLQFPGVASVIAYFGAGSTEATLAANYFQGYDNCTKTSGALYFIRYPETATPATLTGGSLTGISLSTLQTYSGQLFVTVNGTQSISTNFNLNGATSFSSAASIIQAAFTSPPFSVSYNSVANAFVFTTTATGAGATISFGSDDGDPAIATNFMLTSATGAVLSQGATAGDPSTFMDGVVNSIAQNWAGFMTCWQASPVELEGFATWTSNQAPRYWYVAVDDDITNTSTDNGASFSYFLSNGQFSGTTLIYSPTSDLSKAAFALSWASCLDFTRLNGRTNLCFRSQSGLTSDVSSATIASNLLANGCNFYGAYGSNNPANNQNWFSNGSISGSWLWADSYVNQIWFSANLQLALVNLLRNTPNIPYNAAGSNLIHAALQDPINAALNFGMIRTGVTLSAAQIAEIQLTVGQDISTTLSQSGYFLQINTASPTTRAARQSPPCTLYYTDGQSVQQIVLASIEVQ